MTEADVDANFEAILSEQLTRNLSRKREYQDSLEYPHDQYRRIREQLLRIDCTRWGSFTQKYWRILGKQGVIPKDIKAMLKENLKTVRAARTAALQILADILPREDRESLRVQFERAGPKLK